MEEKRAYYAVIPADVRYNKNLKDKAKLLYGELTALANEKGYCWASNSYFAELYEVSKSTISRLIKNLNEEGYINVELVYEGKEIVGRKIYINSATPISKNDNTPIRKNEHTYEQECEEGLSKIEHTPIRKNVKDNNTVLNNTINNTLDNTISKDIVSSTDVQQIIKSWNMLNLQKLISINPGTTRYKSLKARIKEYGLENMLKAIDSVKTSDFLKGQNKNNWIITFDWLIKPNNFTKVLEGNYLNRAEKFLIQKKSTSSFNNFEPREFYSNPGQMDALEKKLLGWDDEPS
ncbi:MAG: helix-turn-helix domain-containing protein [Clostridium sp.]|uniref:helix-turn-helix domain-containing protein n=1 Tax=Clostridium sp. TaxID=1506 RepID=UPI002900F587|nr:helix-turn-helix domain-containing protein [Clostridium sp.]MDU3087989.1 helix-turn-helix domain-containing protein [Clostridium sp.]